SPSLRLRLPWDTHEIRLRERIGQHGVVVLGDAPEAERVLQVEVGQVVEALPLLAAVVAEVHLGGSLGGRERGDLPAATVGRHVGGGVEDVAALSVEGGHGTPQNGSSARTASTLFATLSSALASSCSRVNS